jgi:hypothetical protein
MLSKVTIVTRMFSLDTRQARRSTMKNKPSRRVVRCALAAVCLGTMITGATAGSFTRGCAARDMQLLMLIEEQESSNAMPGEILSDAMLKMMHARIVCHEGYVVDALAIYDTIAQSITPSPFLSSRTPANKSAAR